MSDTNTAVTPAPAVANTESTAPVEGVTPPASTEPAPADRLAKAAERLARDRQAVDAEKKGLATERAALESERAETAQLRALIARADEDPLAILEALGPDAGARLLARLAQAQAADEDPGTAEAKKLRAEWEADKKAAKEAQERQEQASVDSKIESFKGNLRAFGEANRETYELCSLVEEMGLARPYELAWQAVEAHYAQTKAATGKGVVLSFAEALGAVESTIEENYQALFGKSKKLKPKPVVEQSDTSKKSPEANGKANTLTSTGALDGVVIVEHKRPSKSERRAKLEEIMNRSLA